MKNVCKKICKHATLGGTLATAIIHFFCCGLPALLALFSAIFGMTAAHSFNLFTHSQKTWLLVFGAIMLIISFILYFKERKCCEGSKNLVTKRVILYTSAGLFLFGLIFHFISAMTLATPACH